MAAGESIQDMNVLILCGGKGKRLSPLTDKLPKPLIHISGTPILTHLITYFKRFGFKKFIVAAGYRSSQIFEFFEKDNHNLNVEIIDSGDVDIIKRIQDAVQRISGDFIMCYGDTLADVNLNKMIDYHHSHEGILTLTSYPLRSSFGVLDLMESGKVLSFVEKPTLDKWINIGYFYFSQKCVRHINESTSFLEFLHERIVRQEMYSFKHRGIHITVNTMMELREAEKNIINFNKILNR